MHDLGGLLGIDLKQFVLKRRFCDFQRLLNVAADFRLIVGNRILYSESHFPVVELAFQLISWVDRVTQSCEDFSYDSLDSTIPGLIRIMRGFEGWHLASAHQDFICESTFTLEQILRAVRDFISNIEEQVCKAYGFSVLSLQL